MFWFNLNFFIFKLQKYDNTFTRVLDNTGQSYIQFHYMLQLFFK